jgi:hemerythrin-like domain-containing protein
MLRDASLIPLSRQHHNALALCVLSRRALAADSSPESAANVARRVIDQYEVELINHFEIEEQVLFPACGALPLVQQLVQEHRAMERIVRGLRSAPSAALLEQFFELLTVHVRREERELFEELQRTLRREELDRLGAEIDRRVVRVCM